jgi:calcium binding protein 39
VFKVFVANPNKPAEITDILVRNKERLVAFLKQFRNDIDDEQFTREKAYLVKEIEALGDDD